MLHVTPQLYALAASGEPEKLKKALENAIALEHATMPPYLYALFSLGGPDTGNNIDIAGTVFDIAVEEMLHMLLAANILTAIGGKPVIHSPDFVRSYPGPLPGIDSPLQVPLKRFSMDLVEKVFMVIEEPEHILEFPIVNLVSANDAEPEPRTIGEFYGAIRRVFEKEGADSLITHPHSTENPQPRHPRFPEKQTIANAADAVAAINVIVGQGEGTSEDPFFRGDETTPDDDRLAHYYRFAQLVRGRIKKSLTLPPDPKPKDRYFYDANDRIAFDAGSVLPFRDNPRSSDFAEGSEVRQKLDQCNRRYTQMLKALDDAFNGQPQRITASVTLMRQLSADILTLTAVDLGDGTRAGPSFEFLE